VPDVVSRHRVRKAVLWASGAAGAAAAWAHGPAV